MEITNLTDDQLRAYQQAARTGGSSPYTSVEIAMEIARRLGRPAPPVRVIPQLPTAERPPTGQEITQSITPRPPAGSPPQSFGEGRPYTPYVDLPVVGEGTVAAAPPPPPPGPNPLQAMVDKLLAPGKGGGSPLPSIPRIDVKELEKKFPEIGERKAEETYKADPYMTMLQTGLRILAAKPELGQSPISAIAGPVGEGVKEYRGEKEKERTSTREEAKEARADIFQRLQAGQASANLAITALRANQEAAGKELELKQRAAQHGETANIERAKLAIEMPVKLAHARYYESMANKTPQQLAQDSELFEKRYADQQREYMKEDTTPQRRAELEIEMEHTKRLLGLVYGTGRAEVTAAAGITRAQTAAKQKEIDEAVKTMSNPMVSEAVREDAKRRYFMLTGRPPTELPPPPR